MTGKCGRQAQEAHSQRPPATAVKANAKALVSSRVPGTANHKLKPSRPQAPETEANTAQKARANRANLQPAAPRCNTAKPWNSPNRVNHAARQRPGSAENDAPNTRDLSGHQHNYGYAPGVVTTSKQVEDAECEVTSSLCGTSAAETDTAGLCPDRRISDAVSVGLRVQPSNSQHLEQQSSRGPRRPPLNQVRAHPPVQSLM